jgi:cardiolipin synthase (CMP-forming)
MQILLPPSLEYYRRIGNHAFMNIPNTLTLLRILLVPVVIWAIAQGDYTLAFMLFVIAGVTDALDGFIAKRFNMRTELGAYLDPLADKLLIMSIYTSLAMTNALPVWLALLVFSRDVLIMGGVQVASLMANPVDIKPNFLSKMNTTAQITFAALILGGLSLNFHLGYIYQIMTYVVVVLTLASAGVYLMQWMKHMSDEQ